MEIKINNKFIDFNPKEIYSKKIRTNVFTKHFKHFHIKNDYKVRYKCLSCGDISEKRFESFFKNQKQICTKCMIKENNMLKYGVENISQLSDVKKKKIKTCLKNYGVENPTQSVDIVNKQLKTKFDKYGSYNNINKIKNTIRRKYNVDNISQLKEVQEKIKKTNIEKYGYEHHMQSDIIYSKQIETNLLRYGCHRPLQNKHIKKKYNK